MATVGFGAQQQQQQRLWLRRHLQDGTGTFGGQRDGLIPQTTPSGSTFNANSDQGFDNPGKDLAIILLSFLAVILLTTLVIRWLHPCRRRSEEQTAGPAGQEGQAQILHQEGDLELSRKAKLSKLKRKERKLVLQKLFESTTFNFTEEVTTNTTPSESETADDDTTTISREDTFIGHSNKDEMAAEPAGALDADVETGAAAPTEANGRVLLTKEEEEDEKQEQQLHDDNDDIDNKLCCSICLTEYETGDSIMTGKQCTHMFHADCFLLWAVKRDHCPYCRKKLFTTPYEFRTAALQVLGEARVKEIAGLEETEQEPTSETTTSFGATTNAVQPTDGSRAEDTTALDADARDDEAADGVPVGSMYLTYP